MKLTKPKGLPLRGGDDDKLTPNNRERAKTALETVKAYIKIKDGKFDAKSFDAEFSSSLQDLLNDIGHLCDYVGADLQDLLRMAGNNYAAETDGRGVQFTTSN